MRILHLLGIGMLLLVVGLVTPSRTRGYFPGGGADARKGNDCLIGYDFVDPSQVTDAGTKKQAFVCVDCDPSCDLDGVTTPNGSCTMAAGVCINQSGVTGCTPPSGLDKATAKGKVKGVKGAAGKVVIDTSQLLQSSACGAMVDVFIPLKSTKKGLEERKATLKLSALLKKNKSEGISKRKDKDKLTYVCQPRPTDEACPVSTTTTTSSTTSTIAESTTTSSSVVSTSSSTTTTSVPTTTTTAVATTTSTTIPVCVPATCEQQAEPCGFFPDGCGGSIGCTCHFVATEPPASGGGSCAAPDYNDIQAAVDTASAGDVIRICPGTYDLTASVTVPVDLSFVGFGRESTVIDGSNGGNGVRLIDGPNRNLAVRHLTLRNGVTDGLGGAISAMTLAVSDSTFTDNMARTTASTAGTDVIGGGAIFAGDVDVKRCLFNGNVARFDHVALTLGGGAILGGTVKVKDSEFANNSVIVGSAGPSIFLGGGAILASITIDVGDSIFAGNMATGEYGAGGAIYGVSETVGNAVTVARSTFISNGASDWHSRGGAIYADPSMSVVGSTFVLNTAPTGGALWGETVIVDGSTFDANVASDGGAIAGWFGNLANSTFKNNAALASECPVPPCYEGLGDGGAIQALGSVAATNCTFVDNSGGSPFAGTIRHGGALGAIPDTKVTLTNTILVGYPGQILCSTSGLVSDRIVDGGGNFSGDASCAFTQATSHANVDVTSLALGPLADNGGPTPTVALGPSSVAIGAGSCVLPTDQRGSPRPGTGDSACDSGAYERQLGPCPSQTYTFGTTSSTGGLFTSAQWPGGTSTQSVSPGCSVTVQMPDASVTLVCTLAAPYKVLEFNGYSSCTGVGGEDGDGCQVTSCPPLGIGSCCSGRPSCSTGLNGAATASFTVQCYQ